MEFGLKDTLYIIGIIVAGLSTFFTTRHNLKEYVRDKVDELKDKIHKQEIELEKIKGRDENQQQIINLFQTQILDHLPKIYDLINSTKKIK
jgi:hypothetical protein